jgi:hypothetical protein
MKSDIRLPRGPIIFTASTLPLAPALAYGPEAASATHGLWAMVDSGFNAGAKGFTPS